MYTQPEALEAACRVRLLPGTGHLGPSVFPSLRSAEQIGLGDKAPDLRHFLPGTRPGATSGCGRTSHQGSEAHQGLSFGPAAQSTQTPPTRNPGRPFLRDQGPPSQEPTRGAGRPRSLHSAVHLAWALSVVAGLTTPSMGSTAQFSSSGGSPGPAASSGWGRERQSGNRWKGRSAQEETHTHSWVTSMLGSAWKTPPCSPRSFLVSMETKVTCGYFPAAAVAV